eukprot:jgi/Bigna1/71774/fgenesh1_pg.17_\
MAFAAVAKKIPKAISDSSAKNVESPFESKPILPEKNCSKVVCCRWLQATRRKIRLRESLKTVLLHRLGKMWILWRRKRKMARQSTSSSSAAGLEDENRATVKLQRERSLRESGFRDDDGLWNTDTQISPTNAVSRPAVEEER